MKNKIKAVLVACSLIAIPLTAFAKAPVTYYCGAENPAGIFHVVTGFADFIVYLLTGAINICA